ncbi:hypothetical protein RHOSPDRAFT_32203 [Rhodotorula sp. JG-1b]|nr:hypothetical protein RHOSPDRAFT_32203 [Rhodotorula sp. JG-1b]
MAATDSNTALFDQTKQLLATFTQHAFESHRLASSVPVRDLGRLAQYHGSLGGGNGNTENYTRWTQGATDLTGVSGVSDEGLIMDAGDRGRATEDLKLFKEHISDLKFAYLESNAKLEFVNHILNPEGYQPVVKEAIDELELNRKTRQAELADQLMRECEAMETEIAMLKNKRSPSERLTIEQISATLEAQDNELVSIGQRTKQCEDEMKSLKPKIKSSKINIERFSQTAKQLRREQEERDAKGMQDERAEKGCEWIDTTMALYKSLLGIHNAYAIGSPPTAMMLEFGPPKADKGSLRRLRIDLGGDGRMSGAELLDSSDEIQDLVQTYLPAQDVRSLVQEVRTRFGC